MVKVSSAQLGLFDSDHDAVQGEAALARARMREMIDRVSTATEPLWKDAMGAILDDGSFQRAMHLVPAEEAQALWAEYDAHMTRLCAVWGEADLIAKD